MCLERTEAWEADLTADAEHQQAILRERWPDAEVSEVEPAAVGGGDALKLTYTYTDGGVTHCVVQYTTAVQIRTAVDAVGYRLYFYPPAENPESFDAVRDAILNSLEFLKTAQGCYPEDYTYNRNIGGGITIATYLGNDENICIPDEIDGRQVTAISEEPGYYSGEPGAFSGCGTLRAVTIPEGVTKIGDNSFAGCVSLQTVYVPTTVKEIGSSAFSNCPSLKRVIFAGDAPSHGNYVFDASLNVSVIYRKGTSGWEDTWAGRPTCLLDNQTVGVDSYTLSDQGIAFLEKMCYFMPDWSDYASLNESFWQEFLFRSFTSPELTDNGTDMTVCGGQELADTPWGKAVKVSRGQTVEPYVNDSKKLSPKRRDMLYEQITAQALGYATAWVGPEDIDRMNILQATRLAFAQAFAAMPIEVTDVMIDALTGLDIPARQHSLIHGDALCYSIAAASIVAKVERDRYMERMDALYPEYGFARNKGYGTAEHIAALKKYGPCPLHRRSFIGRFCPEA